MPQPGRASGAGARSAGPPWRAAYADVVVTGFGRRHHRARRPGGLADLGHRRGQDRDSERCTRPRWLRRCCGPMRPGDIPRGRGLSIRRNSGASRIPRLRPSAYCARDGSGVEAESFDDQGPRARHSGAIGVPDPDGTAWAGNRGLAPEWIPPVRGFHRSRLAAAPDGGTGILARCCCLDGMTRASAGRENP